MLQKITTNNFYQIDLSYIYSTQSHKLNRIGLTTSKYFTQNYTSRDIYINDDNLKDGIKKYNSFVKNNELNNTLLETDVVYFDKTSIFPRFKFKELCNNTKTINLNKADKIILHDISDKYNISLYEKIIFYSKSLDAIATTNYYSNSLNKDPNIIKDIIVELKKIALDFQMLNIILIEKSYNFEYIYDETFYDKLIFDSQLERLLTKDSIVLNQENYNILDNMLKSTNDDTVSLAIKMLTNYNISQSSLLMLTLICNNITNIKNNKSYASVGFKNIRTLLNLDNIYIGNFYDILLNALKTSNSETVNLEIKNALNLKLHEDINKYVTGLLWSRHELQNFHNVKISIE